MPTFLNPNGPIDKRLKDSGISDIHVAQNPAYNSSGYAAPKSSGSFLGNLGKTIASLPGEAINAIGSSIVKPLGNAARAISQGLPGIGTNDVNYKSFNERGAQIDALVKKAHKDYASGKITKAAFRKRLDFAGQLNTELSKNNHDYQQTLISPTDAVKSLAEVAAMPFGGELLAGKGAAAGAIDAAGSKIPSVAEALAKTRAAKSELQAAAKGAVTAPVKYSLLTKPTIDTPIDAVGDAAKGDYKGAAGNAALAATIPFAGGAAGLVTKAAKKVASGVHDSIYGVDSLFHSIKLKDGSTFLDYFHTLQQKASDGNAAAQKAVNELKVFHQYKLDESNGDVKSALEDLVSHYANRPMNELNGQQLSGDFRKLVQGQGKVDTAVANGKLDVPEGLTARVGRFSAESKKELFQAMNGKEPIERFRVAQQLAESNKWGDNPLVKEDILKAAKSDNWKKELSRVTSTNVQGKVAGLERGYFPTYVKTSKVRANFKPVSEVTTPIAETTESKIPGLKSALRKAGVSTETASPATFEKITKNSVQNINDIGISSIKGSVDTERTIGSQAMDRLARLANEKRGVSDIRQLSVKSIANELGISDQQARQVRGAIDQAHFKISLGERGLGQRIQDWNYKFNPLSRSYARIQAVGKYELNPFFKAQEAIETALLSKGLTGAKTADMVTAILGTKNVQPTIGELERAGLFRGASYGNEAASIGSPFISSNLGGTQKRMIASVAQHMATERGISVSDLMKDDATRQLLRSIVQYPSRGFFSSNASRTLNLLTFPVSYNLKVARLAGQMLAKQNPVVQVATIKGITDFNGWLSTPDGIKWSSKNSELLGLVNYFTPINSIQSVMNILGANGKPEVSDFGIIGGLPFGVISQILSDNGIVNTDRPYQDPKTGQVVPQSIPKDTKAEFATVITDLINSMYNYPGRRIGADQSKKNLTQGAVPGLKTLANSGTYSSQTQSPGDKGKKVSDTLKASSPAPASLGTVTNLTLPKTTPAPISASIAPAKAKKQKAYVNGYKTTTARPMPKG